MKNYGKYMYQRKSTEIMHRLVDEHENMDKSEIFRVLAELRDCVQLEVFYPLKQAMNETKKVYKIEIDEYFRNKQFLIENEYKFD